MEAPVIFGIICVTAVFITKMSLDYAERAEKVKAVKEVIASATAEKLVAALDKIIEEEVKRATSKDEAPEGTANPKSP